MRNKRSNIFRRQRRSRSELDFASAWRLRRAKEQSRLRFERSCTSTIAGTIASAFYKIFRNETTAIQRENRTVFVNAVRVNLTRRSWLGEYSIVAYVKEDAGCGSEKRNSHCWDPGQAQFFGFEACRMIERELRGVLEIQHCDMIHITARRKRCSIVLTLSVLEYVSVLRLRRLRLGIRACPILSVPSSL